MGNRIRKCLQFLVRRLEVVGPSGQLLAGLKQVVLDSASNGAERSDDRRPYDEDENVRKIFSRRTERLMKRIAPFAQLPFALGQEGIGNVALIMVILAQCEKPARRNVRWAGRASAVSLFAVSAILRP